MVSFLVAHWYTFADMVVGCRVVHIRVAIGMVIVASGRHVHRRRYTSRSNTIVVEISIPNIEMM